MNKAEELKRKLIDAYVLGERISNKDFKDTLQLYADEQSREEVLKAHSRGWNEAIKAALEFLSNQEGDDEIS